MKENQQGNKEIDKKKIDQNLISNENNISQCFIRKILHGFFINTELFLDN